MSRGKNYDKRHLLNKAHPLVTDVKSISVQHTAISVALFIFPASQVSSKNYSGCSVLELEEGLREGETGYSITVRQKTSQTAFECL